MLTEPKEDVGVGACVGSGVGIDIGMTPPSSLLW